MSDDSQQKIGAALQHSELLATQKREDEALAIVDEALAQLPGDVRLLLQRAWLLIRLDRHEPAIETLRSVLGVLPQENAAHYMLSVALCEIGEYAESEAAIRQCLETDPGDPDNHLQYAHLLTQRSLHTRGGKGKLRKEALEHVATALSLDPERAGSYRWASVITWRAGKPEEAKQLAEQGLAIAPEDEGLLASYADLTAATTQPTSRYDAISQPAAIVAEMTKLLAINPQHRLARRTLFVQLWFQRMQVVDAPLVLLALFAIAIGITFRSSGSLSMLITGAVVVPLFGGFRLMTHAMIVSRASPGYRRLLARETPLAALRRWLTIVVWTGGAAGVVAALFLRDSIAIRWLLVAFGLLALLAFANSVLWHLSFSSAARGVGGFSNDLDSMQRIADYRGALRSQLGLRIFGAFGLIILMLFVRGGREDAMPVVLLCIAGMLATTIVGLFVMRRFEQVAYDRLPEGTTPGPAYRRPGMVGFALLTATALGVSALFAVGAANLPVLPNQHDAVGHYALSGPPDRDVDDEDRCRGRPAARAACVIERMRERMDRTYDITVPSISLPKIDIPEVTTPSP